MDKRMIKMLALTERMMDEGKIPFVMAPSPSGEGLERLAVSPDVMNELGLEKGQTVNSIIFDAIMKASLEGLVRMMRKQVDEAEESEHKEMEEKLNPDFDFRSMLDGDGNEPTKH